MELLRQLLKESAPAIDNIRIGDSKYAFTLNEDSFEIDFEKGEEYKSQYDSKGHSGSKTFPATGIFYLWVHRLDQPEGDLQIPDLQVHVASEAVCEWDDDSFSYQYGSEHGTHGGPYTTGHFKLGKQGIVAPTPENKRGAQMLSNAKTSGGSDLLTELLAAFNKQLNNSAVHQSLENELAPQVVKALVKNHEEKTRRR